MSITRPRGQTRFEAVGELPVYTGPTALTGPHAADLSLLFAAGMRHWRERANRRVNNRTQ